MTKISPADEGIEAARRDAFESDLGYAVKNFKTCAWQRWRLSGFLDYFNRESDGTTYWHTDDGWMAAPTQINGTPDLNCVSYVEDFKEHMAPEDYAALTAWLSPKVCEGGDGCDEKTTVRPYSIRLANKDHTVHYCDDCAHLVRVGWLPEVKLVEGGAA